MPKLAEIRTRIKSVFDTRKITGAMETVSIAKFQRALTKHESNKPFYTKISELMREVANAGSENDLRFFGSASGDAPAVYIVIASDKGMAGAYNLNVAKHAWEQVRLDRDECSLFVVGRAIRAFFEKNGCVIGLELPEPSVETANSDAKELAELIRQLYHQNRVGRVYLTYTRFYEGGVMKPETMRLLPLLNEELGMNSLECRMDRGQLSGVRGQKSDDNLSAAPHSSLLTPHSFEPSAEAVLEQLIPKYLSWTLYGAFLHAATCEHNARRLAMRNATKNADEMLENLTHRYHRARQETITNELNEIVSSAIGLSAGIPTSVPVTEKGLKERFPALKLPAAEDGFVFADGKLFFAPKSDNPLYAELIYQGLGVRGQGLGNSGLLFTEANAIEPPTTNHQPPITLKLTAALEPAFTVADNYAFSALTGAMQIGGTDVKYRIAETYALASFTASDIRYYLYFESDEPAGLLGMIKKILD
ncbi:MAG: ATP synthase F1 subunit gamma [Firmicutes bacterium]|nr:ATP synthase F1 subunit gamma [Bacillota bacterium]